MRIQTARVTSTAASAKTLKNRTLRLGTMRETVSGGDSMGEVAALTPEYRKQLLDEIFKIPGKFIINVPPTESLALKCDLQLPWAKLREMRRFIHIDCRPKFNTCIHVHVILRRWLKCWGIAIAGEQKMRNISADLLGENLVAETIPLTFRQKDGGEEILPAPIAYTPNLWGKVENLLNHSDDNTQGYIHYQYSTQICSLC